MSEPRKRPQQTDEILVLDNEGIDRIRFYGWDRDITPPALWDAVHDRTERFQPVEECPELTVAERKSVGLGETPSHIIEGR